jgi:hypothetical protein
VIQDGNGLRVPFATVFRTARRLFQGEVLYVETETVLHEGAQTHLIVDLSNHRVPAPDVA